MLTNLEQNILYVDMSIEEALNLQAKLTAAIIHAMKYGHSTGSTNTAMVIGPKKKVAGGVANFTVRKEQE